MIGLIPYAIAYALKKCWFISQNNLVVMQMYNSKGPNPNPSTKTLAAAVMELLANPRIQPTLSADSFTPFD